MAQYTCVTPGPSSAVATGVAVTSSDTISGNDVNAGAVLLVTAGATPTTVTIVDPGHTPAGSAAAAGAGATVAANTTRAFGKLASYISDANGTVTVNYSSITTITAQVVA